MVSSGTARSIVPCPSPSAEARPGSNVRYTRPTRDCAIGRWRSGSSWHRPLEGRAPQGPQPPQRPRRRPRQRRAGRRRRPSRCCCCARWRGCCAPSSAGSYCRPSASPIPPKRRSRVLHGRPPLFAHAARRTTPRRASGAGGFLWELLCSSDRGASVSADQGCCLFRHHRLDAGQPVRPRLSKGNRSVRRSGAFASHPFQAPRPLIRLLDVFGAMLYVPNLVYGRRGPPR